MIDEGPALVVFWGDTKELLDRTERRSVIHTAVLEDITPSEVLLREVYTQRVIVVQRNGDVEGLKCSLCKDEHTRKRYAKECEEQEKCALRVEQVQSTG